MARSADDLIAALDIGSAKVCCFIAQEDGELSPVRQSDVVWLSAVNPISSRVANLVGTKDRISEPLTFHCYQRVQINSHLGQPHPLRHMTEAMLKICDTPSNLNDFVSMRRQRQDRMVIGLCHTVPHPEGTPVILLGHYDAAVGGRKLRL